MQQAQTAEEDHKKKPVHDELMKCKSKHTKEINLNIVGNYGDENEEINFLFLSFSNLTKTLTAAKSSLAQGDDN